MESVSTTNWTPYFYIGWLNSCSFFILVYANLGQPFYCISLILLDLFQPLKRLFSCHFHILSLLFYIANVGIFLRAIQFYSLFFAFIAVVYNLVLGFCNYSDIRNPLYDCTQLHNDSTKVQNFVENIAEGTKKAGTLRLYADDTG